MILNAAQKMTRINVMSEKRDESLNNCFYSDRAQVPLRMDLLISPIVGTCFEWCLLISIRNYFSIPEKDEFKSNKN